MPASQIKLVHVCFNANALNVIKAGSMIIQTVADLVEICIKLDLAPLAQANSSANIFVCYSFNLIVFVLLLIYHEEDGFNCFLWFIIEGIQVLGIVSLDVAVAQLGDFSCKLAIVLCFKVNRASFPKRNDVFLVAEHQDSGLVASIQNT